jgi:5-methyltetrahydrofolate--homocysteine methyltransferase
MLKKIVEGRWLTANAVMGIWPANRVNHDDIALYTDDSRSRVALTWHGLRQQTEKPAATGANGQPLPRPNRCLADFVAPLEFSDSVATNANQTCADGQKVVKFADHVGAFAVTTGIGAEQKEAQFLAAHDDYNSILFKALADRLAEAFAELMHWKVRTDLWGYAPEESFSVDELIAEKYRGIRPAPGYPACPDHSVKRPLFELLGCADIGLSLTENLAMWPAASVCGFYLAHPESTYFNVGKVGDDQVADLSRRCGTPEADLRRLLAPNL